jgi:hypothetical protein
MPVAKQILLQFARGNIGQLTYIEAATWEYAAAARRLSGVIRRRDGREAERSDESGVAKCGDARDAFGGRGEHDDAVGQVAEPHAGLGRGHPDLRADWPGLTRKNGRGAHIAMMPAARQTRASRAIRWLSIALSWDTARRFRTTDMLIRDVPDDVIAALDNRASRLGLSRSE